jgi:hypothetical protein
MQLKRTDIPRIKAELLKKQKGLCLICKRNLYDLPSKNVHLHHIHQTGEVVGVLCGNCNRFEGRVLNWYIRTGLQKTGINIKDILIGLLEMYNKKSTNYIHPTFGKKKRRPKKKKNAIKKINDFDYSIREDGQVYSHRSQKYL